MDYKKLLSLAIFTLGVLTPHMTFSSSTTEASPVDFKIMVCSLPVEKIMTQAREKIFKICTAIEMISLRKFSQNNQATCTKFLYIIVESLDDSIQQATSSDNTAHKEQANALTSQPQDYQQIRDLLKSHRSSSSYILITPATRNPNTNQHKMQLIDQLFETSKFNNIKTALIRIVTKLAPYLNLDEKKAEAHLTHTMKQYILANLTENEIADMIQFFNSNAFQRITQHANEFLALIYDNLPPQTAAALKELISG